ncbi:hypothetical protein HBI82_055530 [Parastagonospora nodorum]|nr:hypothetical protein HBI78_208450 [Parastagonospora nodorum]KAH5205203.1 hypothetical protein HBH77_097580 [Parastagonospora nodorum]KAH5720694.1 hypothetical protein HBI18_153710 [Parastagonospora nodorum]KAH6027506.1 hypothetical protein HBI82_055530 [Parastagonospora nodorum]
MATPNIPAAQPDIPAAVPSQDVVAIVTIHGRRASLVNRTSIYAQADVFRASVNPRSPPVLAGVNIFLHRHLDSSGYSMGRAMADPKAFQMLLDVYLPDTHVAKRQFEVVPDWERDCWRLQSTTETVTMVNGAPIQLSTRRKKDQGKQVPAMTFLKQSGVNIITIHDFQIDVWLMKSVRQVHGPKDFVPLPLDPSVQDVSDRPEQWARDRFIATTKQVSAQTVGVIDRFSGMISAAKIFRSENHPQQFRDREFLAFSKQDVDASIVRYLQTTQIDGLPAIITDAHAGFQTYGVLRHDIHRSHPGIRFSLASKMALCLYRALAWMHFHGIFHGQVSDENILIRLKDGKPEHVLLVGYTTARHTPTGKQIAFADMLTDAQATMKLVEDCCDIWTFRNGPTRDAQGEHIMQKRTQDLMLQYHSVRRCSIDFIERLGNSPESVKGAKLIRLQNKLGNDWSSAQRAQQQNLMAREVALLGTTKLKEHIEEWQSANPPRNTIYRDYMLLTLGHPVLDSLSDGLHVKPWDAMPHEVCSAIKQAGGQVEEPWQTFQVQKTIALAATNAERYDQIMAWLAASCEIYPEWHEVLEAEIEKHLRTNSGMIGQGELEDLHSALQTHGPVPASMTTIFRLFADMTTVPEHVEELYNVSYHIPSRMFNITQLQRLATPENLAHTITEGQVRCDNFVEVRGDAKVEGCYVSLSLLTKTVNDLGLLLLETPHSTPEMPTFDTADFSQVPQARIVLARPGMIGFGSMLREGDQANFLYSRIPDSFIDPNTFIATYFGDMKVLPELAAGTRTHYVRPEHWSKYKTAKESESLTELNKRDPLKATSSSHSSPGQTDVDETLLGQLLRDRELIRAAARPPTKHSISRSPSPSRKRVRVRSPISEPDSAIPDISMSFVQRMEERYQQATLPPSQNSPFMNNSFMQRNSALLTVAPNDPTNVNVSFTVGDETECLDDDWKIVDEMLAEMPDEEPEIEGVFGFRFHGSGSEDGTEVDPNSVSAFLGKGGGTAANSFVSTAGSNPARGSFGNQQSRLWDIPESPTESWSQFQQSSKGPAHGAPPTSLRKHIRRVSDDSSEGMPSTAPPSPRPLTGTNRPSFGSQGGSTLGSTGLGNSFGPQVSSTATRSVPPGKPSQDSSRGITNNQSSLGYMPTRPSALNPNRSNWTSKRPGKSSKSAQSSFNRSLIDGSARPVMDFNASFGPFRGNAPSVAQASPPAARPIMDVNASSGRHSGNAPRVLQTSPRVARSFRPGNPVQEADNPVINPGTQTPVNQNASSDSHDPPTEVGSPQADSAGGAISGFLLNQLGQQSQGGDEDMPDTDEGESD